MPNEVLDNVVGRVSPNSLDRLSQSDADLRARSDTVTARLHAMVLERTIEASDPEDLDALFGIDNRLSADEWKENVPPRTLRDLQTPELAETLSKLPARAARFVGMDQEPAQRSESFTRMRAFAREEMQARTHTEKPAIVSKLLAAQLSALHGLTLDEQRAQRTEIVGELRRLDAKRLHHALRDAIRGMRDLATNLPAAGQPGRGEAILCLEENLAALFELAFAADGEPQPLDQAQRAGLLDELVGLINPLKHTSAQPLVIAAVARGGATLQPDAGANVLKDLALQLTDCGPSDSFADAIHALFFSMTARFAGPERTDVYSALVDCIARQPDFRDRINDAANGVTQCAMWRPQFVESFVDDFLLTFAQRAAATPLSQRAEAQGRYQEALVTIGLNIAGQPLMSRGLNMVMRHADSIESWVGGPHAHQLQQQVRRGLIAAAFVDNEGIDNFTCIEQLRNAMARRTPAHSQEWNRAFALECQEPAHEPVLRDILSQPRWGQMPSVAEVEQRMRDLRTEPNL